MNERIKPITMESDAERAWRYGFPSVERKAGEFKSEYLGWMFPDGSVCGHVYVRGSDFGYLHVLDSLNCRDWRCLPFVADRMYPDAYRLYLDV